MMTCHQGFFSKCSLGGNCFYGERKYEKHPRNKQNLLVFGGGGGGGGGEFKTLVGESSPPKGPEKNTACHGCLNSYNKVYRGDNK